MKQERRVSVIGLGYVGLPVAVAFGHKQNVIAFDINQKRVEELKQFKDITAEVSETELRSANIIFTSDPKALQNADFHIIAVPTPVNDVHQPDFECLVSASELVGKQLKKGDIVVYESTVYPGATEEVCLPVLEQHSKLKGGQDFFIGYSPERINPGDTNHRFTQITKVVSGQTSEVSDLIAKIYGSVVEAGIYQATSIKVAEAAKVIENTQRDLNIALMNELAIIFERMDIDTNDVIKAASTKWNFLPFKPGLVGGHCIGVDPFYLTYKAQQLGYHPEVILAGRRINDGMGKFIAEQTIKQMIHAGCPIKGNKIAVLGLTFKENCPDLRNTKVVDVIQEFKDYGAEVLVHDPIADAREAEKYYGIKLVNWEDLNGVDAVALCVAHHAYQELTVDDFFEKFKQVKVISDVKGILNSKPFEEKGLRVWRL